MSQVIPLGPAARMLTTREAAQRLGVSLRTVQMWVEASILPAAKTPGGHRRIPFSAVEALAVSTGLGDENPQALPRAVRRMPNGGAVPLDVLLVADDPEWLARCGSALEVFGAGLQLRMVETGYLALLQIGQRVPDLLVTSLDLPGMDGFEMLNTLERCESLSAMSVMAMTELCDIEMDDRGGLPDSVEVVSLPVTPEALAVRIGRWLIHRRTLTGARHE